MMDHMKPIDPSGADSFALETAERNVTAWNARNPAGTRVLVCPAPGMPGPPPFVALTDGEAFALRGTIPMVRIQGEGNAYLLSECRPVLGSEPIKGLLTLNEAIERLLSVEDKG